MGFRDGKQNYKCTNCGTQFIGRERIDTEIL